MKMYLLTNINRISKEDTFSKLKEKKMDKKRMFVVSIVSLILLALISCSSKNEDNTSNNNNLESENEETIGNSKVSEEEIVIVGTIEDVKGDVLVIDGNDSGVKATYGMEVAQGSSIKTAENSSATLKFSSEIEAYISSSTHVSIEETDNGIEEILLTQHDGFIYHAGEHDNYYVQTDSSVVTPLGTHFFTEVDPLTGNSIIRVGSGIVQASSRETEDQSEQVNNDDAQIFPGQSILFLPTNDDTDSSMSSEEFFDIDSFIKAADSSIIEAILRNKEQIDRENGELVETLRQQISENGDVEFGSNGVPISEEELSRLESNLNNLIRNIINKALKYKVISEVDIEDIINEINSSLDNNNQLSIDDFLNRDTSHQQSTTERDEQRQREMERRMEQQEQLRRQMNPEQNQQDRQAELLALLEQQRTQKAQADTNKKRQLEQQAQRTEEHQRLEEQRKKEEETQQKREKQLLLEKTAPSNLSLKGLNYFGNEVNGEITFKKAKSEKHITKYNLYWINDKDKKTKISSLKTTGTDLKYKFKKNSEIPNDAKGVLVVAANNDYESKHTTYMDLTKLSGRVSFSQPLIGDGLQFAMKVTKGEGDNSNSYYKLIDLEEGIEDYNYGILLSDGEYDLEYGFVHNISRINDIEQISFSNSREIEIEYNKNNLINIKYKTLNRNLSQFSCNPYCNGLDDLLEFILDEGDYNEDFTNLVDKVCTFGSYYEGEFNFLCSDDVGPLENLLEYTLDDSKIYMFYQSPYEANSRALEGKIIVLNYLSEPIPD